MNMSPENYFDEWRVVSSIYYLPGVDVDGFSSILFVFEEGGKVHLSVREDTDEINVILDERSVGLNWTQLNPLSGEVKGLGVRWFWFLINSGGYKDGVQFEFGAKIGEGLVPRTRRIQIMAAGSTLDLMEVVVVN